MLKKIKGNEKERKREGRRERERTGRRRTQKGRQGETDTQTDRQADLGLGGFGLGRMVRESLSKEMCELRPAGQE